MLWKFLILLLLRIIRISLILYSYSLMRFFRVNQTLLHQGYLSCPRNRKPLLVVTVEGPVENLEELPEIARYCEKAILNRMIQKC